MEGKVTCITATCGRHTLMERSLRLFLNQDYEGTAQLLIYQNSEVPIEGFDIKDPPTRNIVDFSPNIKGFIVYLCGGKEIKVINRHIDATTGKPYESLGAIYNDEFAFIDEDTDIVVHWDDDDIFLQNHISAGVKGLVNSGKKAYKPRQSYYRHPGGTVLMENVLEPSIFFKYDHLKQYGYSLETTAQHHQWLTPLINEGEIMSDLQGIPTLIYNWGDDIPTFKTSGDPNNPNNFNNYRNFSADHGDRILTPWKKEQVNEYYYLQ